MFDERRLNAQLALRGMTKKKLAELLGMNEGTFYRKINRNGDFTREEINKIIEILKIENPSEIFFAKELA